jgi:hypothetical protein
MLLTLTAVRAAVIHPWVAALGLGLFAFFAVRDFLVPMLRNWLSLDRLSIAGSLNGEKFQFYWSEILAAWLYERRRRQFLCLGTRDGSMMIPLRFMDQRAIWECVCANVAPEALREDAIRRLPDFQDWVWRRDQVLQSPTPHVVTDHWLSQMVAWGSLTCFILGLVGALQDGQPLLAGSFALLAGASLRLLLGWGVTEFTPETIRRHTLFGGWEMDWAQVERIEMDPLNSVMVLVSAGYQRVLPGPGLWSGSRRAALGLFLAQVERLGIPVRRSPLALLKFSHRIRKGK